MLSASAKRPRPMQEKQEQTMRRADRLFQIIQVLRRTRKPLTADAIAAELETSKRTIYRDEQGRDSARTIWPIAIGYHEAVRILAAWCELRSDFRSFRTDRVIEADYLDEKYPERREALRAKWRRSLVWEAPKDV